MERRILIIDDDIDINNMSEKVLIQAGYSVFYAYSGKEVILFLQNRTFTSIFFYYLSISPQMLEYPVFTDFF